MDKQSDLSILFSFSLTNLIFVSEFWTPSLLPRKKRIHQYYILLYLWLIYMQINDPFEIHLIMTKWIKYSTFSFLYNFSVTLVFMSQFIFPRLHHILYFQ